MSNHDGAETKFVKIPHDLLNCRRVFHHFVRYASKVGYSGVYFFLRIYQRAETFLYLAVYHFYGANLYDFILQNTQSRGFKIKNHYGIIQKKFRRLVRRGKQINLIRFYVRLRLDYHIFGARRS